MAQRVFDQVGESLGQQVFVSLDEGRALGLAGQGHGGILRNIGIDLHDRFQHGGNIKAAELLADGAGLDLRDTEVAVPLRRAGLVFIGLALAVSWAWVFLGVRYPSDILRRAVLAMFCVALVKSQSWRAGLWLALNRLYESLLEGLHLPQALFPRSLSCLAVSPPGGISCGMTEHIHETHPAISLRLKRAEGHLRRIALMIEEGRHCLELATQLRAVERAVAEAKRALIHDHIDHCLTGTGVQDLSEIKAMTKLL